MTGWKKQRRISALFFFVVISLFLSATPCFSSSGVLLSVEGKVSVLAHGLGSSAKTGMRLMPGVTVKSEGGRASLLLDDGKLHKIKEGGDFTVPEGGNEGDRKQLVSRLMETIRETTSRGRGPTIRGMVRGKGEIPLVYPSNSFVTSGNLWFEWEAVEGLVDVEVSIKSPSPVYGYDFGTAQGTTKVRLPDDAPPLTPGIRYYWKVSGVEEINREAFRSKLSWFVILAPEREKALEAERKTFEAMQDLDQAGRDFLEANLFISYGLCHRAEHIINKSLEQHPDNEGMKELRLGVQVKMKKAAAVEKDESPEQN